MFLGHINLIGPILKGFESKVKIKASLDVSSTEINHFQIRILFELVNL